MSMEIEIKFLEIDKEKIIEKLKALGARKVFEGEVIDLYFDFNDMRLNKNGKLIRLRKEGNRAKLTFKERVSKEKFKIMKETEIEISDFEGMRDILETLGMSVILKFEKNRITYILKDVKFEIDTYPGVPTFLEIEAKDEKEIKKYAELLGFSLDEGKNWTGKELLEYYGKM